MPNDKKNNGSKVTEVFLESRPSLISWVKRFLNRQDDVEDIVQETFLRSYRALLTREIENPKAYLFSAAKNLALKHNNLSANKLVSQVDDMGLSEVISLEDPVIQTAEAYEEMSYLCEAIRELPLQCRRVFILKKVYGLTHKEIAARLDISHHTVHQHLSKGVARCSLYMRKHGFNRKTPGNKVTKLRGEQK